MKLTKSFIIYTTLPLICILCGCYSNLMYRGRVYEEHGDYRLAIDSYQKAVEASSKMEQKADAHRKLGQIYILLGLYDDAIREFKVVRKMTGDDAEICYYLGYSYYERGEEWLEDAAKELERSIQSGGPTKAHFYLGAVYLSQGKYGLASNEFNEVVKLEDSIDAKYYLAISCEKQGKYSQAIEQLIESEIDEELKNTYSQDLERIIAKRAEVAKRRGAILNMNPVFSSIYKYYHDHPIGTLTLTNQTDEILHNIRAEVYIKNYMDIPTVVTSEDILPNSQKEIELYADFNNNILNVTENIENQTILVILSYDTESSKGQQQNVSGTFFLYSRNAMSWQPNPESIAAFITPKDEPVEQFAKKVAFGKRPFERAIQIYDALNIFGVQYLQDPNDPYGDEVDYVRYPRQTLDLKKGDCDDVVVLYASCLENVRIDTALILAPEHIFLMLDTGIHAKHASDFFLDPNLYEIRSNNHAWIPVEATMLGKEGTTFFEAWSTGVKVYSRLKFRGETFSVIDTKEAWKEFKPATLPLVDIQLEIPGVQQVSSAYEVDVSKIEKHREDTLKRMIDHYLATLKSKPNDVKIHNRLGVLYAKRGDLELAEKNLRDAILLQPLYSGARNNLGNVFLLQGRHEEAKDEYEEALRINPENVGVYLNLAMMYYTSGHRQETFNALQQALQFYSEEELAALLGIAEEVAGMTRANEADSIMREIRSLLKKSAEDKKKYQEALKSLSKQELQKLTEMKDIKEIREKLKKEAEKKLKKRDAKELSADEVKLLLQEALAKLPEKNAPQKPVSPIDTGAPRGDEFQNPKTLRWWLYWSEI